MKIRAILFDLDGTLIDQFEAIHSAFSQTLNIMGFPIPSFDEVKRAVGGASDSTMVKLIGPERAKEAVSILRPIFEREMLRGVKVLAGVMDGLTTLREKGIKCGVLTNKYGPHARATCQHLGINKFLEFTLGANDTEWKKPSPELTQLALNKIGHGADETLYVGDSPYDQQTAANAGLKCYLLSTGTHSLEELSELPDVEVFQDFSSLIQLLESKIHTDN